MSSELARLPSKSGLLSNPAFLPYAIAVVVCAILGVILGYMGWYFLGEPDSKPIDQEAGLAAPASAPPATSERAVRPPVVAPAGELPIPKGTITLGGGDSGIPVKKFSLEAFAIGRTEVTNEEYYEFVSQAAHKAPDDWRNGQYASGTANDPVVNVTWQDAVDYCDWISGKIGATVRLPTEPQWEMAARGPEGLIYPWGNQWDDRAAISTEKKGSVRPVMSFPRNRSPFGAYDMAGNVWEWVDGATTDDEGYPARKDGVQFRVAKGGSANEPAKFITAQSRVKLPANKKSRFLGFRYIVLRDRPPADGQISSTAGSINAARE